MKFAKTAALIMSLSIAGAALCACNNQPEPVSSDINVIATQTVLQAAPRRAKATLIRTQQAQTTSSLTRVLIS